MRPVPLAILLVTLLMVAPGAAVDSDAGSPPSARAAKTTTVELHARYGDKDASVAMRLDSSATEASAQVYIAIDGPIAEGREPRFSLSEFREAVGSTGAATTDARPPTGATLAITVGAQDVTNGTFTAKKAGEYAATLTLRGLNQNGTFEVDVLGSLGPGPVKPLVTVVVERYPAAALRIREATDGTNIRAETHTSTTRIPITISGTNLGTASDVRLQVGTLATPDRHIGTLTPAEGSSTPLIPAQFVAMADSSIVLDAELDVPGTYSAPVLLDYDGTTHAFTLTIAWIQEPLGVEIVSATGTSGDIGGCGPALPPTTCDAAAVWLTLHENAGRTVVIDRPDVVALVRKVGTTTSPWERVARTVFLDCGADLEQGSKPAKASCGGVDYDPDAGTLAFGPGSTARVLILLTGDLDAGEYTAGVSVTAKDRLNATKDATIALRESVWAAIIALALGAGLGYLIRTWLQVDRPRLVRQLRLSRLAGQLERALLDLHVRDDERPVVDAVRGRIARVQEAIERGETTTPDALITDVAARVETVPRWLTATRILVLVTDAAEHERIAKALNERGDRLSQPGELSADDQKALSMATVEQTTNAALRTGLTADVAKVRNVKNTLTKPGQDQFTRDIEPRLERATRLIDKQAWERARREIDDAMQAAAKLPKAAGLVPLGPAGESIFALATPELPLVTHLGRVKLLDRLIRWGDRITDVTLTVLTVGVGVTFLYVGNATWGGWGSWLAAVVWAAGIQEFGNASFTGVLGIRAKLATPPA